MISFGIDTSLSSVSFAIRQNGAVLAEFESDAGRGLADKIGEIMKNLLNTAKISAGDIQRCGLITGPGSFTGLRIGIAFAKGFFADSSAEITEISSLECAAKTYGKGNVSVLFDARQDEVFFARFEENGRISEDERISFEKALEKCAENDTIIYSFSGNSNSPIKQILSKFECFEAETLAGRGITAAEISEKSGVLRTIDEVFPNYMQVSYAEKMRNVKCGV